MVYNTAMDAFFADPNVVRQPPAEVRILRLGAAPLADRKRVQIKLALTPFERAPEIELSLSGPEGEPCGTASILEPFSWKLAFTLHIRHSPQGAASGKYRITAVVSYPEIGEVHRRWSAFTLPEETR